MLDGTAQGEAVRGGALREIACDESGSDGENLIGGNTDVFAHAGVHLPVPEAAAHIQEIRDRIRSPAVEYKANHLLRQKHRPVLVWFLGPDGPLTGHAHVHLTDKSFLVVTRIVELLLTDGPGEEAHRLATDLHRAGPAALGRSRWHRFLELSGTLLRTRDPLDGTEPVAAFFAFLDALAPAPTGPVGQTLARLGTTRARAHALRTGVLDRAGTGPVLDPMLPAVARTIAYWSGDGHRVAVVHDQQNALTPERVAWLRAHLSGLSGVRFVDSRSDPRVQLADFLAGVARRIASDELGGHGDRELSILLRPYVDTASTWADPRSWSLLAGP
ncbi:DUF3800 domain-containing protein [Streptomyces sp. NPDC058045]|uniref:DUF3800 domain-containing protein n=1 Tax=Streptomyces sp. NPDC058045 TaxID=3346311 RepID=UPI0036ED00C7